MTGGAIKLDMYLAAPTEAVFTALGEHLRGVLEEHGVDLDGTFKKGGSVDILEGEVYFGSPNVRFGCTNFHVERILADQALF